MSASSDVPPPAVLLRRMGGSVDSPRVTLGATADLPPLRCRVEAARGSLILQLSGLAAGEAAVQWLQGDVPLTGQISTQLHLANLTVDDTDLYAARWSSPTGAGRTQAALVVVMAGNPLLNWSVRGFATAERAVIGGCVIGRGVGPVGNKRYLIRGIGPTLKRLGIERPLPRPRVEVIRRGVAWQAWESFAAVPAKLTEEQQRVGAFALDEGASEFVGVARLPPGAYTIVASSSDGEAGEVLVEMYELPD